MKVIVECLAIVLTALAGLFAAGYYYHGFILAYLAPDEMPIDAGAMLKQSRARLERSNDPYNRWVHLADVAFWTVDTGDLKASAAMAEEALAMAPTYRKDWNYGNVIHKANLTRGRIALRTGYPQAAATFLLEAGRTPGSPQLDSFGPNMLLAKEMLEAGQSAPVIEYIELTRKFWEHDGGAIYAWEHQIQSSGRANFATNLLY